MKVTFTNFSGLKIIQSKTYKDNRGFVKESYKQKNFKNKNFIFAIISSSKKNVVRGLRLQTKFKQREQIYHLQL